MDKDKSILPTMLAMSAFSRFGMGPKYNKSDGTLPTSHGHKKLKNKRKSKRKARKKNRRK